MRIRFVDEAGVEFLNGISYYEKRQTNLGRRFKLEVEQTIRRLANNSENLPTKTGRVSKTKFTDLSYYFPYIVRGSTLWILAIAHQRRIPEYWIQREKNAT